MKKTAFLVLLVVSLVFCFSSNAFSNNINVSKPLVVGKGHNMPELLSAFSERAKLYKTAAQCLKDYEYYRQEALKASDPENKEVAEYLRLAGEEGKRLEDLLQEIFNSTEKILATPWDNNRENNQEDDLSSN